MAWQPGSATDYRDYLTQLTQFATSKHVATVAVNNGGTATYVVGDIMTLTHASAHLDAKFEVTSVAAGVITGLRIVSAGAFAQQAVSATVSAAGSGYKVDDIIEVQGGSSRCPAKFKVLTLTGSGVATVGLFEGGGTYSTTPANPAAAQGVGSNNSANTYAGDDAATLTVTYQTIIGTTALAVTGGSGGGSPTVDITLAETGWSVDGRNVNSRVENSLNNEKEVTLVGDATGFTNKPYIHLITLSRTSGLDTRYSMAAFGSTAHNAALPIGQQANISNGISSGDVLSDDAAYTLFPQNKANNVDYWFSADTLRIVAISNTNPTATTDDGEYLHAYFGFYDRAATESEDPFPLFIGAASRDADANPGVTSTSVTGIAECRSIGTGPYYFYHAEAGVWREVKNNAAVGTSNLGTTAMWPLGEVRNVTTGIEEVVDFGPLRMFNLGVSKMDRSASTTALLATPGTVAKPFIEPLVILRKPATSMVDSDDSIRGNLRGVFWVYNDDGAGAAHSNFSEDYITIGSDRYRVFHTHKETERYQYICVKEA